MSSFLSRMGVYTKEERFKQTLEQAVEQARNPRSWSSFPSTYNRLLAQFRTLNTSGEPPSFLSQSLGELMLNLTRTRTPNRAVDKFVASVFLDIKRGEWKIPLGTDHYLAMIRSRAQGEDFEGAEEYLQECLEAFAFSTIPSRIFIALLGEYRRYNDYESVWRVYRTLKAISPVLDRRVYDLVQDVVMSSPVEFLQDHILELQSDYERAQLGPIPRLSLLLATFVALGQNSEAKDAAQKLRRVLESGPVVRYAEQRGWEALIRYSFATDVVDATSDNENCQETRLQAIPFASPSCDTRPQDFHRRASTGLRNRPIIASGHCGLDFGHTSVSSSFRYRCCNIHVSTEQRSRDCAGSIYASSPH